MRRVVLIICFTLLLPVQWTFAAAAAYCMHESGPAVTKHVGHHEHVHNVSTAESSEKSKSTNAGTQDLDCDYCHLSASQWLPALHAFAQPVMRTPSPPEDPLLVGSHIGSGPERPDRTLAV